MSNKLKIEMQIMQDNLCDLRKIAGWTAEVLAVKLGITKQTISNIENQKVKISTIQYIAIRSIFECELASNPSNTTLRKVMGVRFQAMPLLVKYCTGFFQNYGITPSLFHIIY